MCDKYAKQSEKYVRQPLPFYLRKTFKYFTFFLYLTVQYYTCHLCARWRHELRMRRAVLSNSTQSSFNSTTNMTQTSFTNQIPATNFTESTITGEDVRPLYAHMSVVLLFMLGIHIFIFALRTQNQMRFAFSVCYLNWITLSDVSEWVNHRQDYLKRNPSTKMSKRDEKTLKTVLTLREKSCIQRWTHTAFVGVNPRVSCFRLSYPSIDRTLTDFMFTLLPGDNVHQILGSIEIVHDVMKALDFLHYGNAYHLNLNTDCVKLHCNGLKVYVKLSGFNFMKKAADRKVSSTSVGLTGFYRPLECSVDQEVDAEKCDTWGLGMIALDLFTGGMFRILTETQHWDVRNSEEHIRKFIQRRPFFGYVQAAYGVIAMFQDDRYRSQFAAVIWSVGRNLWLSMGPETSYKTYRVCHLNFLYELRCFVYRLLIFSPKRRISLDRAFKEPLIENRGSPLNPI